MCWHGQHVQSCVKRNLQGAQNFAGVFTAQVGGKFHWPMARNLRKKTQPPLEVLDVKGLCEEWDACEEIRDRLRQGNTFLHPDTKDTVDGCCKNSAILVPILTRMAVLEFKSLPPVDPASSWNWWFVGEKQEGECPRTRTWCCQSFLARQEALQLCKDEDPSWRSKHSYLTINFQTITHAFCICELAGFLWQLYSGLVQSAKLYQARFESQVETFQDMCLILDPTLQAGCSIQSPS